MDSRGHDLEKITYDNCNNRQEREGGGGELGGGRGVMTS